MQQRFPNSPLIRRDATQSSKRSLRSTLMHCSAFCWKKHVSLFVVQNDLPFHVNFGGKQSSLRVHESSNNPSKDICSTGGGSNRGCFPLTWFFVRQWVQEWVRSFRAKDQEERLRASSTSSQIRLPLPWRTSLDPLLQWSRCAPDYCC